MAELSQREQLALHEFSVRYRAEYARKNPTSEASLETVTEALREEYEKEQDAKRSPTIEPSTQEKDREPEEPEP